MLSVLSSEEATCKFSTKKKSVKKMSKKLTRIWVEPLLSYELWVEPHNLKCEESQESKAMFYSTQRSQSFTVKCIEVIIKYKWNIIFNSLNREKGNKVDSYKCYHLILGYNREKKYTIY